MANKIQAGRLIALKARVKAECQRRAYTGSVAAYGGADYDYAEAPATGGVVRAEHRQKLADPLRAIHSGAAAQNQQVAAEDDLAGMEAFVAACEGRSKTDSSGSDCASSCTGLCYGCTGTCTGSCTGSCTGCTGCGSGCSINCSGTCKNSCGGACDVSCYNNCSGSCKGSCKGGCTTTCMDNCTGGAR